MRPAERVKIIEWISTIAACRFAGIVGECDAGLIGASPFIADWRSRMSSTRGHRRVARRMDLGEHHLDIDELQTWRTAVEQSHKDSRRVRGAPKSAPAARKMRSARSTIWPPHHAHRAVVDEYGVLDQGPAADASQPAGRPSKRRRKSSSAFEGGQMRRN